jgi:hypothetical protein
MRGFSDALAAAGRGSCRRLSLRRCFGVPERGSTELALVVTKGR